MANEKEKKDEVIVRDREGALKRYPAKPGVLDYVKEAFEPTDIRADINAVRERRKSYRPS